MPGRALLDTSIIVEMLRGDHAAAERVGLLDEAFTSVVVVGELLYGTRRSANAEANLERIAGFVTADERSCLAPRRQPPNVMRKQNH